MIMFTVYIHRNKINNKAYIGQTCQVPVRRWERGLNYVCSTHFYRSIKKYGWDNFEHIIFATDLTQNQANHMEKLLIAFFDTTNQKYGYNMRLGGENSKLNEQTRKKIKDALSKNPPFLGKKHNEESKMNMRLHWNGGKKPIPIRCIELNQEYESASEAGRKLKLNISHITQCCIKKRKTCGKYHFEYV